MDKNDKPIPTAMTGLSARLLVLTIFFVMLAEFLIYTPSVSRYRKNYLEQRIATAHVAVLALQATPDNMVSPELEEELLYHAGAYAVALKLPNRRVLMLAKDMPPKVDVTFDLRQGSFPMWISDAYAAMFRDDNRVMRVIGESPKSPGVSVEIVIDEAPMRHEMLGFSSRILQLSIAISLLTAGLVYLSLLFMMVRPMGRITRAMIRFREDPEDISRTIRPSGRQDEIGVAEYELAQMQKELHTALAQKTRLATLGAAVAKVNHDLRNSLATAVLVSDRLADIDDPEVQKVTPRLYRAIDKAVNLCSQTLNYVSGGVDQLNKSPFHLSELISEVFASLRAGTSGDSGSGDLELTCDMINDVAFEIDIKADRRNLFRVFENLVLNAVQAGATTVRVSAGMSGERIDIDIDDNGSGMTEKSQTRLFEPFTGSSRDGGTGLGLVIARDIVRNHGGDLKLKSTGPAGTCFTINLPQGG